MKQLLPNLKWVESDTPFDSLPELIIPDEDSSSDGGSDSSSLPELVDEVQDNECRSEQK